MKVYTRREFLRVAGLGLAAVTANQLISISNALGAEVQGGLKTSPCKLPSPIKGVVSVGGKPYANVAVSDGLDIVLTDTKGRYLLANKNGDAPFVFVVQPNETAKSSRAFYKTTFQVAEGQKQIDFALLPAADNQSMTKTRFALITDIHTSNADQGGQQLRDTEDVFRIAPQADFILADGDLVEKGNKEDEFADYMPAVERSPIPYFNVVGNHDVDRTPEAVTNYRRYVGPDYYSFDQGGVHFVVLNSITPSDRQNTWFEKDVTMLGKGRPVVIFQHYPPTSEQLQKLDKLNIHSIFTGHWHSERVVKSAKTISVTTPTFDMGGIDFSPAGFRVVDISADGTMKMQYRPTDVSKLTKIVWPTGIICKTSSEIIANIYDSSIDAKKVRFKLSQNGQVKASGELKQQSPLNWTTNLPDAVTGDAKISIEVEGQPDWKTENNFTKQDCSAPAIQTAGDWPMFMGNAAHTGVTAANLNLPLTLVWSTNTGGDLDFSSPILAAGKLFVAVRSRRTDAFTGCLAIEPVSGKILWRFATQQSINHSPAYEAGVICIAEVGGRVYGISADNGKELWRHDLGDNIGRWIYGAPAADDGKFYVGTVNRFARMDAKTGRADWEKRLADGKDNDWISTYCSPAIAGKYLAMGGFWTGGDNLFVVEKQTGERIWSHPADRGMHASPTIAGDRLLFTGKDSQLFCCNLADGESIWQQEVGKGWSATTPAVKDNVVFAGTGEGTMKALKLSDGAEIWSHNCGPAIFEVAAYGRNRRAVLSSGTLTADKIIFTSADGKLYCLDLQTGKQLWSFDFGVPVMSTPLISGNAIFVTAGDGRIYALCSRQTVLNKDGTAFLTGRDKNENCYWQRPCRLYIQRTNQGISGSTGPYC